MERYNCSTGDGSSLETFIDNDDELMVYSECGGTIIQVALSKEDIKRLHNQLTTILNTK